MKDDILTQLENRLAGFSEEPKIQNIGIVEKNTDGVITVSGLSRGFMGEDVLFENGTRGMILGFDEDYVSVIVFGAADDIKEGTKVKKTGQLMSVPASEELLGRVINPLGQPLDGKPLPKKSTQMPLEKIAPGVIDREPVDVPLKTGIKSIDSMIPIGRGQRELIIGDRGIGKTAIALDTIINQKNVPKGQKRVICIYVAIGQKQSSISQVVATLEREKALDYSIIVSASSSEAPSFQYIAPYAATSLAEYFMQKGEDVLIVYDDLTKHAWAYRQISLILRRPAGREAYPGDIFYLHSRLLERAVKLNKKLGGGSITALPIIETQAGDISAYIPTNVISITDGQIYLQSDLFNSGQRPAVNAGSSVSRVGTSAQTATMKSVAGKIRLELAQYNELAAFAQFGSELDENTQKQLDRGRRTTEILKQPQYNPLPEELEVLSFWAVNNGYMDDVPTEKFHNFEKEYHNFFTREKKDIIKKLSSGQKIDEGLNKELEKATVEFKKAFSA